MKLIVGLGNPGTAYVNSRHNIGFSVVKELAKKHKIEFKKDRGCFALTAKIAFKGQEVILAMPQTFMNLSGLAVRPLLKKYKVDLSELLVVCDDLDLEFGRLKIKPGASSAGHQGIKSIIDSLKAQGFPRLRIGVGRPPVHMEASEFVLLAFTKQERLRSGEIIKKAADCCRVWISDGITQSMNMFNQKDQTER
jgi:peptidyl-tRNA hydrolase, PTH1 family